ncbi:hypothetical protein H6G04_33700 [Calothrix membranacea FACHB-236]|nr:hypothetical protein [Calothrix membranacea FACHB-236]
MSNFFDMLGIQLETWYQTQKIKRKVLKDVKLREEKSSFSVDKIVEEITEGAFNYIVDSASSTELISQFRQKEKLLISYENQQLEAIYDVQEKKYIVGNNNQLNNSPNIQAPNNIVGSNNIQGSQIMIINYHYKINVIGTLKTPTEIESYINEIAQALPEAEIEYKQQ